MPTLGVVLIVYIMLGIATAYAMPTAALATSTALAASGA